MYINGARLSPAFPPAKLPIFPNFSRCLREHGADNKSKCVDKEPLFSPTRRQKAKVSFPDKRLFDVLIYLFQLCSSTSLHSGRNMLNLADLAEQKTLKLAASSTRFECKCSYYCTIPNYDIFNFIFGLLCFILKTKRNIVNNKNCFD